MCREFSKTSSSHQHPLCGQITIQSRGAGPSRALPSRSTEYRGALPVPGYTEKAGVPEAYQRGGLSSKCTLYLDKEGGWKCYIQQLDTQPWRLTPTSFPLKKARLVLPHPTPPRSLKSGFFKNVWSNFLIPALLQRSAGTCWTLGSSRSWPPLPTSDHGGWDLGGRGRGREGEAGSASSLVLSEQELFTSHPGPGCISASDPRRLGEEPPSKSHLLCGKNKIPPTWDSVISPGRKSVENFSETEHAGGS